MHDKNVSALGALKEYLNRRYDISHDKVNAETSLLFDLEIKGDDIDEFFPDLIAEFKIKMKLLNLSRFYLGDEPFDFISPAVRLVKGEHENDKPTITIGDVINFIETGILE